MQRDSGPSKGNCNNSEGTVVRGGLAEKEVSVGGDPEQREDRSAWNEAKRQVGTKIKLRFKIESNEKALKG